MTWLIGVVHYLNEGSVLCINLEEALQFHFQLNVVKIMNPALSCLGYWTGYAPNGFDTEKTRPNVD